MERTYAECDLVGKTAVFPHLNPAHPHACSLHVAAANPNPLLKQPIMATNPPAEVPTDTPPTATPEPTVEPTPSAEERLDRGIELFESGDFEAAVAELEAANLQDPDNVEILANLGGGYLELDRAEDSIAVLEQALAIDAEHPLAMSNLCTMRALIGDVDVIDLCQAALAANPNNAGAHNGLGVAYFNTDQLDLAAEQFMAAIEIDPESLPIRKTTWGLCMPIRA